MDEFDDDRGANDEGHEDGPAPYYGRDYYRAERDRRETPREDRERWGY